MQDPEYGRGKLSTTKNRVAPATHADTLPKRGSNCKGGRRQGVPVLHKRSAERRGMPAAVHRQTLAGARRRKPLSLCLLSARRWCRPRHDRRGIVMKKHGPKGLKKRFFKSVPIMSGRATNHGGLNYGEEKYFMDSEKAYVPEYKDLPTCARMSLVMERKAKNRDVWVVNGDDPTHNPIHVEAVATLTPDGKVMLFAVHDGDGKFDFDLDVSNVKMQINAHHGDKFPYNN